MSIIFYSDYMYFWSFKLFFKIINKFNIVLFDLKLIFFGEKRSKN